MNLLVLMKARDLCSFQGQEKHWQAVSKSCPPRVLQAGLQTLIQSLRNQWDKPAAAPTKP